MKYQTVKRLFQQVWGQELYSILCLPFVSEFSILFSFWLRSPLSVAEDINHYSSKPKILARSAQNFCNETGEIQTNLLWDFTPASSKEKFKSKRKKCQKKSELDVSFLSLIKKISKVHIYIYIYVHLVNG